MIITSKFAFGSIPGLDVKIPEPLASLLVKYRRVQGPEGPPAVVIPAAPLISLAARLCGALG
jgi:hypothetical protein